VTQNLIISKGCGSKQRISNQRITLKNLQNKAVMLAHWLFLFLL